MNIKKLNRLKWLCLLLAAPAVQAQGEWGIGCGEVDNKACRLTQGQKLPAGSLGFQYTAGAGGAMKLQIIPISRQLLSPFFHIDSRAKTVALYFNASIRDNHNNVTLTPGTYNQSFEISEDKGGGYNSTFYSFVINVAPLAK
jgi:hypothetical protein